MRTEHDEVGGWCSRYLSSELASVRTCVANCLYSEKNKSVSTGNSPFHRSIISVIEFSEESLLVALVWPKIVMSDQYLLVDTV